MNINKGFMNDMESFMDRNGARIRAAKGKGLSIRDLMPLHMVAEGMFTRLLAYVESLGGKLHQFDTREAYEDELQGKLFQDISKAPAVTWVAQKTIYLRPDPRYEDLSWKFYFLLHEVGHLLMSPEMVELSDMDIIISQLIGQIPEVLLIEEAKAEYFNYQVRKALGLTIDPNIGYLLMTGVGPKLIEKVEPEVTKLASSAIQFLQQLPPAQSSEVLPKAA